MRAAVRIVLTEQEQATLERWVRGRVTEARLVQRARIVLEAAQGRTDKAIAEMVELGRRAVGRWRRRFAEKRCAGIEKDLPRSGRKPVKRDKMTRLNQHDHPAKAARSDPLERSRSGFAPWDQPRDGAARMECGGPQAALGAHLQAEQ